MMRQIGKQRLTLGAAAGLLLALCGPVSAIDVALGRSGVGTGQTMVVNPLTGVAMDGMDAVSYFTQPEPLPGSPGFEYEWRGTPFYFATAANLAVFARAPEVYAPQFGGYGVTGLSRGFLSDGNPRIYAVFSNRLYLFYSTGNRQAFEAARLAVIRRATANWEALGSVPGDLAQAR